MDASAPAPSSDVLPPDLLTRLEVEAAASAIASRYKLAVPSDTLANVRALALLAAEIPAAAARDLGFALGSDGAAHLDSWASATQYLAEYRARRAELWCRYPADAIESAPVDSLQTERKRIRDKI